MKKNKKTKGENDKTLEIFRNLTIHSKDELDDSIYFYSCKVLNVKDGDTVTVLVDTGFNTFSKVTLRLFQINAPEKKGSTKKMGVESMNALKKLLPRSSYCYLKSVKRKITRKNSPGTDIYERDKKGKFGRYLGILYIKEDNKDGSFTFMSINGWMVEMGFAEVYDI